MSRKPTLSPTKMLTYLACPVKYYWAYVNPLGRYYQRPRPEFTFGANLHRVLQLFHAAGGVEAIPKEQLRTAFESIWSNVGFESQEQAEQHRQLGLQMLDSYYDQQAERKGIARTLFTERLLRKDMGRFVLIGRLDRVDEYPDGTLEIIDYKSGRDEVTYEQIQDDFALVCYQLLLRHHYPNRPILATIVALRTGAQATTFLTPTEVQEMEEIVRLLGEEILDRDFENLVPQFKPLCRVCEFLPLCLQNPEFSVEPTS